MADYLDTLNEAQRLAVINLEGPMLVIAGAGSGKTRVLTYRIVHLMNNGVDPFNILALTFTNKAAKEMKKRIATQVGSADAKNLWMGTFHSVFAKILRIDGHRLGYPQNYTIYDAQDAERVIKAIIKDMMLDKDIYKSKQILNRISSFKNSLITVKSYFQHPEIQEADAAAMRPRTGEIYREYVDRCFKASAMDFDDLLLRTNELLNLFPEVLAKYQDKFRYIMVDEYQDTNHSQYLIVKALAARFENICVVGDDAQSIYAFRGANVRNILNFQKDYANMKMFKLEQNYRSSSNIVQAANSVISNNRDQLKKDVWTINDKGEKIKIIRTITDNEEGRYVADTIKNTVEEKQLPWDNFAILYRTNMQSRALEDALRKKDIPYRIYSGLSFYQRKEIKDLLSYFRLIVNHNDEEALWRIINFPARGIGKTTMDKLVIASKEHGLSLFETIEDIANLKLSINAGTIRKLNAFTNMIKAFKIQSETENAFVIAENVVKNTGMVKELQKDHSPDGVMRLDNVQELINSIKVFTETQKEIADSDDLIATFLEDVALLTDADKDDNDTNKVSLMTIHTSKGLEFPHVFIVGMEEELFPSGMSINTRSELEEERRLFYVAITRAEKQVYLSFTQSRYRWGKISEAEPSRFIEEIDDEYLEYDFPKSRVSRALGSSNKGLNISSNLRVSKPISGTPPKNNIQQRHIRKLKPINSTNKINPHSLNLKKGNIVKHDRFGIGEVISIEGTGDSYKASINFNESGLKNLLLKFAKLEIIK